MNIEDKMISSVKESVKHCILCKDIDKSGALCIDSKEIGLNYMYPENAPINIMFIAESPPRLGNGFFYDSSSINTSFKKKLFKLINLAELGPVETLDEFNKKGYYLADAINCRWNKEIRKKLTKEKEILTNCSRYLEQQIALFKPRFIVAMGNMAKEILELGNVKKIIKQLGILEENIIKMSFILTAPNETDKQRVEKLSKISRTLNVNN